MHIFRPKFLPRILPPDMKKRRPAGRRFAFLPTDHLVMISGPMKVVGNQVLSHGI